MAPTDCNSAALLRVLGLPPTASPRRKQTEIQRRFESLPCTVAPVRSCPACDLQCTLLHTTGRPAPLMLDRTCKRLLLVLMAATFPRSRDYPGGPAAKRGAPAREHELPVLQFEKGEVVDVRARGGPPKETQQSSSRKAKRRTQSDAQSQRTGSLSDAPPRRTGSLSDAPPRRTGSLAMHRPEGRDR